MTNTQNLARLQSVDLRAAWSDEAGDFTPWLAAKENLDLLGETIGLQLELEAQEKDVGPFRADILCRDVSSDNFVLIENRSPALRPAPDLCGGTEGCNHRVGVRKVHRRASRSSGLAQRDHRYEVQFFRLGGRVMANCRLAARS